MQKEQTVDLLGLRFNILFKTEINLWKRDCHDDIVAWSTDLRCYL